MNGPSIIVSFILVLGLLGPLSFLAYLLFILSAFSAMAVLPPELLGGTSLTPGSVAVFLFVLRAMADPAIFGSALLSLCRFKQLGWLGAFFIIAIIGAIILPVIFENDIQVYGLRTPQITSLQPSVTNFTQTGYLLLSVLTGAAVCSLLRRRPQFIKTVLNAILAGGISVVATGLVDILANATGHDDMLKMFYTANYGYSAGEILNTRRVLGLTPEPSAFGGLAITFCAMLLFLQPLYPRLALRSIALIVGLVCGLMAFLSTSSAAYAAMFALVGLYMLYNNRAISTDDTVIRKTIVQKMSWGFAILGISMVILLLDSDLFGYIEDMVDTLIFKKVNTSSFIERSSWTAAGLKAFVDTWGMGVGVGSVRTSNFFANILASTGVLGTLCFFLFLGTLYTRHAEQLNSRDEATIKAAKFALIPTFTAMFLAGTTPDFGVIPGVLFGIIAGVASRPPALASENSSPVALSTTANVGSIRGVMSQPKKH